MVVAGLVIAAAIVAVVVALMLRGRLYAPMLTGVEVAVEAPNRMVRVAESPPSTEPYEGLGAWLDVFDFSPAYGADGRPAIEVSTAVEEMAAADVQTIFVQAARFNSRGGGWIEDPWVLAELLIRAHEHDMAVVAWYLPSFAAAPSAAADPNVTHVEAMVDFEVLGHRFDGVALDIEAEPEPTDEELRIRNESLIALSSATRFVAADMPVGAIVLPPPLIEDVNDQFWPEFPWGQIAPFYDVWLPMSYWSGRSNESGFGDGYNYNAESSRRIRERIGQPNALIHGIGGIGGVAGVRDFTLPEVLASVDDFPLFAQSLVDANAIGGSIYDWQTQDDTARQLMTELFTTGVAADLAGE